MAQFPPRNFITLIILAKLSRLLKEPIFRLGRIYFSVYGSGLGHVTRILEISKRIKQEKDCEILFSCSDQALEYLRPRIEIGDSIVAGPALDVEWSADGSFSSSEFIPRFPFMFNTFLKQVQFEAENISKFDPKLVVSDSKLSPILAIEKLKEKTEARHDAQSIQGYDASQVQGWEAPVIYLRKDRWRCFGVALVPQ